MTCWNSCLADISRISSGGHADNLLQRTSFTWLILVGEDYSHATSDVKSSDVNSPAGTKCLPAQHYIEDGGRALTHFCNGGLQRGFEFLRLFDALAVLAEMRAESFVVGAVELGPVIEVRAFGGAAGVVMDMALFHRLVAFVVKDHDEDRKIMQLRSAERL